MDIYMNVWDTMLTSRWMTFYMSMGIYIKNMYKSYCKTHIYCHKKNYSFPQHVATRQPQSYIKRRYPLTWAIEQTVKTMFYAITKSLATPKLTLHASMLPHCYECIMSFLLLHVRFRGTPRLLHPKMIHIAPRRMLVSFYPYITNICRACKKNLHQQMKIYFPYLS